MPECGVFRPHVLEQQKPTGRLADAAELSQTFYRIRHRTEDESGKDRVEDVSRKLKILDVHLAQVDAQPAARCLPFSPYQHLWAQIDADNLHGRRVIGKILAGADADFKCSRAFKTFFKALTPLGKVNTLEWCLHDIVYKGNPIVASL